MRTLPDLDLPHLRDERSAAVPVESPETLRAAFQARRAAQEERLVRKHQRDLRNCTVAGAAAGLAAVVVTCAATRHELFWHSFLWESLLGAVAGHVLVRRAGGLLTGILLFSGAYLLATLLRAMGLDLSVVFQMNDVAMIGSIQGNMTALIAMAGAGALIGHVVADG